MGQLTMTLGPPAPPSPTSEPSRTWLRPAALLLLVTIAAFSPALVNGFVWDDDWNVTANRTVIEPGGIAEIWTNPFANQQFYPLTHTSFWLQYRLFGAHPLPYHLANLLLHAAGALLLYRILLGLRLPGAWAAAAIFAVHPLQVESVAWITERKNVLSGFFLALAVLAFLRHAGLDALAAVRSTGLGAPALAGRSDGGGAISRAAVVFFALALAAKSAVATAPVALLAVIWWKRGRILRSDWIRLAPLLLLALIAGLTTAWLERQHVGAIGEAFRLSLAERVLVAGRVLWHYVGQFVAPFDRVFIPPRFTVDTRRLTDWLYPVTAVAIVPILWSLRRTIGRGPLAASIAYGALIAPASGMFDVYFFRYAYVQDHFQYFAIVALACFAAAGIALAPAPVMLRRVAIGLLLAGFALGSAARCTVFRDAKTLWLDTIARNPEAWMAHVNLGNLLFDEGAVQEAAQHYLEAGRLAPNDAETMIGLARGLEILGRDEEAIAACRRAIALRPDHPVAHNNLANLLLKRGETAQALAEYDAALALNPRYALARANREGALGLQGSGGTPGSRSPGSGAQAESSAESSNEAGGRMLAEGRPAEALALFDRAVAADPAFAVAHYNRGVALERLARPAEALAAYRDAVRLDPSLLPARANLAMALYRAGAFSEAWQEVRAVEAGGGTLHPGFLAALDRAMPRPASGATSREVR